MIAASPAHPAAATPAAPTPVLEIEDLRVHIPTRAGLVKAVDGVSFAIMPGEILGVVGESGSGKSVTALSVLRLLEVRRAVVGGRILFQGEDVLAMPGEALRRLRGGRAAMVFQDPMTSLNPVLRVGGQIVEGLLAHGNGPADKALETAKRLIGEMGLPSPEVAVHRFPHQFSGGMQQRIMLAMGFGNTPALLIADEPTTALDVTIQAQILALLRQLNVDYGTAIMLITHDLGVVASICTRVVMMYAARSSRPGRPSASSRRRRIPIPRD
jgi:peptide/nickel transport system ATP-binding protein